MPPPFPVARIGVNGLRPGLRGRGPIAGAEFQSEDKLHRVQVSPSVDARRPRRVPREADIPDRARRAGDHPAAAVLRALQPISLRPGARRRFSPQEDALKTLSRSEERRVGKEWRYRWLRED